MDSTKTKLKQNSLQNGHQYIFQPLIIWERIYDDGRGSWTSIISCDNFLLDFNILDTTPGYVKIFIQKHIKDIHSVSYITRMPRIITQQEARHRINSISQRSQRYVTESYNEHGFYVPEEIDPSRIYTLKNKWK